MKRLIFGTLLLCSFTAASAASYMCIVDNQSNTAMQLDYGPPIPAQGNIVTKLQTPDDKEFNFYKLYGSQPYPLAATITDTGTKCNNDQGYWFESSPGVGACVPPTNVFGVNYYYYNVIIDANDNFKVEAGAQC